MLDSLEKLLLERNKIGPMGAQAAGAGGGPQHLAIWWNLTMENWDAMGI